MKRNLYFSEPPRTDQTIKVLAIGNSFSEDATTYLRQMALADGADLRVMNHWRPGCSLERHHENLQSGAADYRSVFYTPEMVYTAIPTTLEQGVLASDWDYVTLQQVSAASGNYASFEPHASILIAYLRERLPEAKLYFHMTWAYPENEAGLEKMKRFGYASQAEMHQSITKVYTHFSADYGHVPLIPTGEAIRLARASKMGDVFSRDAIHCDIKGRIVTGWVWYEIFTGISPFESRFDPKTILEELTDEEITIMKQAAHDAVLAYHQ